MHPPHGLGLCPRRLSVMPLGVSRRTHSPLQKVDFPADGLESLPTAEPRPALRFQPTRCFLSWSVGAGPVSHTSSSVRTNRDPTVQGLPLRGQGGSGGWAPVQKGDQQQDCAPSRTRGAARLWPLPQRAHAASVCVSRGWGTVLGPSSWVRAECGLFCACQRQGLAGTAPEAPSWPAGPPPVFLDRVFLW